MNKKGEIILYPMYKDSEDFVSSLSVYMDSKNRGFRKIKNKKGLNKFLVYAYDPVFSIDEYFKGKDSLEYRLGLVKELDPKDYALIPLRKPGKTIGHIRINKELLVTEVVVYDDSINEFTKDMNFTDFIGKEIVIVEFDEVVFSPSDIGSKCFESPITKVMDSYLREAYDKDMFGSAYTYLYYPEFDLPDRPSELVYALRTPGATRANLVVDRETLKIKEFLFCDETFDEEYLPELKEKLNKYIDKRINIRNWRG